MRLRLTLKPLEDPTHVPFGYNSGFSEGIHRILFEGSKEYQHWLKEKKYLDEKGKPKNLFGFSKLSTPGAIVESGGIRMRGHALARLYVGTPMMDDRNAEQVALMFHNKEFTLQSARLRGRLRVTRSEVFHLGKIQSPLECVSLSPIFVRTLGNPGNGSEYVKPDHPQASKILTERLLRRHYESTGVELSDSSAKVFFDLPGIERHGGIGRFTKLIPSPEGTSEAGKIPAFALPVWIEGEESILQTALDLGIGSFTELGYGFLAPRRANGKDESMTE